MTIEDAMNILQGDSTAATDYLNRKTFDDLKSAYTPYVDSALDQVKANQIWEELKGAYNTLVSLYDDNYEVFKPFLDISLTPLTTDLAEYTTEKALDGLFLVVGQEETKIRRDPIARVTEILKKVFGTLDD